MKAEFKVMDDGVKGASVAHIILARPFSTMDGITGSTCSIRRQRNGQNSSQLYKEIYIYI